nr:hypothetical protein [Streptomyces zinciresistens]
MRLHTPVSLCLAAAALLATASPVRAEPPAAPVPVRQPAAPAGCGDGGDGAFPLTTKLRGGPRSYTAGGGFGVWYLELANRTGRTCTGIHPVVVLVDAERALRPSQPRLEFYDAPDGGGRPLPVRFETTDRDELVGAFDGFPGYTVGPRRTVTVKVRLALTSDTAPNEVTANAAVVQRLAGDGDWVGQSNDYRFTVESAPDDPTASPAPTDPAERDASVRPADPRASSSPGADAADDRLSLADELARTGLASPPGATIAATAALLLTGIALYAVKRRR